MSNSLYRELRCRACGFQELCDTVAMIRHLRLARRLRPGREPEDDVLLELFQAAAPHLACPKCQAQGLTVGLAAEDLEEWPDDRPCEACGRLIPGERLAVLPNARLCAACQKLEEQGQTPGAAVEYCPHCGSPMELRLSRRAGISRFEMACTGNPPCRR